MGLLQLAPVVILATLICIEAIVLAANPQSRFPRWFPGLLGGVAAFGLLFLISALRGHLVVSPELGLLMMEGGPIVYWSIVAITLSCAISLGLLVPAVGCAVDRPVRVVWPILGSAIVAAFTVVRIRTLNPTDPPEAWISAYDLWSPPLVLWLSVSLVESALRASWIDRLSPRLFAHAFATSLIALAAMNRFEFLDPVTKIVWQCIGLTALILTVGFLPEWLRLVPQSADGPHRRLALRVFLIFLRVFLVLLLSAGVIVALAGWPQHRTLIAWILLGLAGFIILCRIEWTRHRRDRAVGAGLIPPRPREFLMLVGLIIMAMSLFLVQIFDQMLVTLGLFTAWVILAESTGEGAFPRSSALLRSASPSSGVPLWRLALTSSLASIAFVWQIVVRWLKDMFTADTRLGVVLKALLAIVILIVLSELPNARTTIVGNFSVESEAKDKALGQAVANQLVFALHSLNERLRPDVALVNSAGGSAKDRGFKFVAATDDTTTLDTALAKGADIDLGPLKVPLNVLAAPIKGPARQLLGVRVVSGTVHESLAYDTVLARTTGGDAWKAEASKAQLGPSLGSDTARELAEKLALQIATTDRSLVDAGLTKSSDALESFLSGWVEWRRFELEGDRDALTAAIDRFYVATVKDWNFALAHYRLGLALREIGRPGAATEAFRSSVRINNRFGPGLIALASTLYDYDTYLPAAPPYVSQEPPLQDDSEHLTALFRKNEASRLWQKVVRAPAAEVSSTDRATAYAGLCLRAYELGLSLDDSRTTLERVHDAFTSVDVSAAFSAVKRKGELERQREASTKQPSPLEMENYKRAEAAVHRATYPIIRAERATSKAVKQLDALGADEAKHTLEQVLVMLKNYHEASPASESEAASIVERSLKTIDKAQAQRQQQVPIQSFLTYFYCKRADNIYSSPVDTRSYRNVSTGPARVALLLGLTLERRHEENENDKTPEWSCTTLPSLPRGPYSSAALRYFDRGITLAPEDSFMRCQAALTAYNLGDPSRLRALEFDTNARFSLAEQHTSDLRGAKSSEDFLRVYRRALAEYAAAIDRNPNNVEALNGYAYTFWVWHYTWAHESGVPEPDVDVRTHAPKYAERAVLLVEGKRPKPVELMVRSTLGEVLLGLGRFEEAYKVLNGAVNDKSVQKHALFNEIRLDLAHACLCLAREKPRSKGNVSPQTLEAQAAQLFSVITTIELSEETRPFSTLSGTRDKRKVCSRPDDGHPSQEDRSSRS